MFEKNINELIKNKFGKKDEKFLGSKKPRLLQVRICFYTKAFFSFWFCLLFILEAFCCL